MIPLEKKDHLTDVIAELNTLIKGEQQTELGLMVHFSDYYEALNSTKYFNLCHIYNALYSENLTEFRSLFDKRLYFDADINRLVVCWDRSKNSIKNHLDGINSGLFNKFEETFASIDTVKYSDKGQLLKDILSLLEILRFKESYVASILTNHFDMVWKSKPIKDIKFPDEKQFNFGMLLEEVLFQIDKSVVHTFPIIRSDNRIGAFVIYTSYNVASLTSSFRINSSRIIKKFVDEIKPINITENDLFDVFKEEKGECREKILNLRLPGSTSVFSTEEKKERMKKIKKMETVLTQAEEIFPEADEEKKRIIIRNIKKMNVNRVDQLNDDFFENFFSEEKKQ